jgi:signal transduction histidine kinase
MTLLSSLRSRIFLASALLALLCIGVAIYLVNQRVTDEAERTLVREIKATGEQVDQLRAERTRTFTLMARLIADLPKLKAAVATNDPPTVQDIARDYRAQLNSSFMLVTNKAGGALYAAGGSSPPAAGGAGQDANQSAVREALGGRDSVSLLPEPNGIMQVITVPIVLDREILGTLSAGFDLDDELAAQLKRMTGSDLAFGMNGQILASTLGPDGRDLLADHARQSGISRVDLDGQEYEVLPQPLSAGKDTASAATGPVGPFALILRSRTERLQSLSAIHTGLFVTTVVAFMIATLLSFAVARTIVQPLAAITDAMRQVAATGDLTRKIVLGPRSHWDDEDARLLATTFNTLTDSIARFQREMTQRERLTSLGRLSTVIAHEIRNPLMIIKASLHALRQGDVGPEDLREAVRDIDGEVARLNRLVNEVLDFARPIRFELATVDVNSLCRDAASAAQASGPAGPIALDLDPELTPATTDPERLRMALVNMLVNAGHAVNGEAAAAHGPPLISLSTRAGGGRMTVVIADRGPGIAPEALPHVFDPYFTTKRGGTGLGLPIAKNIVEGLGGTVAVSSVKGRGTEVRIELPLDSSSAPPASNAQGPSAPRGAVQTDPPARSAVS